MSDVEIEESGVRRVDGEDARAARSSAASPMVDTMMRAWKCGRLIGVFELRARLGDGALVARKAMARHGARAC